MSALRDLTGQKFGRLLVLKRAPNKPPSRQSHWRCRCDCDRILVVASSDLMTGHTRSCGCLHRDVMRARNTTNPWVHHGNARVGSRSKEYDAWNNAKTRVNSDGPPYYSNYKARGIKMCREWWDSFEAFLRDMGLRPGLGYSLDRIDNAGPYAPGNCRWATASQQRRNQRPKSEWGRVSAR